MDRVNYVQCAYILFIRTSKCLNNANPLSKQIISKNTPFHVLQNVRQRVKEILSTDRFDHFGSVNVKREHSS